MGYQERTSAGAESGPVEIELLAIGNELLRGLVQDTSSYWLCRQLTGRGGQVEQVLIIPDEIEIIAKSLQRALRAKRALIITTGGLGPTHDDLTLQAVAQASGCPLQLHPQAEQMVVDCYRRLAQAGRVHAGELSASRRKMALLPQGAVALANRVGAAPGVLLKQRASLIVSLPGVPPEMRDIFANSLQPYLATLFGDRAYLERELVSSVNDESEIAPLLQAVQMRWPQVYLKSRAHSFAEGMRIQITLTISGRAATVRQTLLQALDDLQRTLAQAGVSTRPLEEGPPRPPETG
ncbi:MAG TPA: competence/damage-inducible protein A [Candidatus Fraserbacteria bacterium]|nr:competence/damage-inducible protein A [Candidatus Fraserbacteria bacterium]